MEAVALLIISILGLTLLVVAVVSFASNLDKQNNFDRKNKSITFKKHKFDKKQAEENDKKYRIWKNQYQSNLKKNTQAKLEKKILPDEYYKSEKYQKFCEERARKYNELVNEGTFAGEVEKIGGGIARKYTPLRDDQKEQVFYGERGGRYRIRYNKDGAPYRDYF